MTAPTPYPKTNNYRLLFPDPFALAHLALANAESLALAAGLIFLLGFPTALTFAPIRFLTPARILARPWARNFRFLGAFPALILAHLAF